QISPPLSSCSPSSYPSYSLTLFFIDTAPTLFYTLSLHDALPISILLEIRHRDAIQQHVGGGVTAAVGNEIVLTAALATRVCFGDAGREICQVRNRARNEWQIVNEFPVYRLSGDGVLRRQQLRRLGDFNGLRSDTHLQRKVHR